jgi:cytoskeleton protein RodZ
MGSFASDLKSEREKRKIPLTQIAADTRISLHHLVSLEEGRYDDLPGGMYNRAFLKAYCESLNLDEREVMQRYEEEFPASEKPAKFKASIPRQTSPVRSGLLIRWSIVLLLLAGVFFFNRNWIAEVLSPYFFRTRAISLPVRQPRQPTAVPSGTANTTPVIPPAPESSAQPDVQNATPSVRAPTALKSQDAYVRANPVSTEKEAVPAASHTASPLRLELIVTEQCWVSLEHDGTRVVRRVMEPGEVQSITAGDYFFLVVGNAGGVHLKINDKQAKPLGKRGEVVKLRINAKNLPDLIDQTAG